MDVACFGASPGARRSHGEAWKVLGGDVASTGGAVAFHQAAWRRGAGKKTPLPLWAGWAGWAGFAWATGKSFPIFLFNLSFLFLYICFGSDKNIKPFYKMLKLFMWHHNILG